MLEQDDLKTVSGYPWLSQIPILKYLFSSQNTEHKVNEIVFVLIPHVVRAQEVSELNLRPLDVGTAGNIELRHAQTGPSPIPAAPAQPAASNPAEPGGQPAAPPATAAELSFDPPQITQPVGATFAVNVNLEKAQNIYQVPVQINYDPKQLQLLNVSNGNFLSRDGQAVALVHRPDETSGTLQVSASRPPGSGGVSGQGTVFTLTFMAKAGGQSTLSVSRAGARDPNMQPVQVSAGQATVTVK
jgi:general secretion pathway protein D